jgi:hypothetical protein
MERRDLTNRSTAHPLPSGRFPLETHFAVLRRLMSATRNGTEPVTPEMAEGQGVPAESVGSNVAFLVDMGLLVEEKPGRYKPTPVAMQLVNTQLSDERRGRRLLRSIVEKTWFGVAARSLPRSDSPGPLPASQLRLALKTAAQISEEREDHSIDVLMEYLVYTGIVPPPLPAVARNPDRSSPVTRNRSETLLPAAPAPSTKRGSGLGPSSAAAIEEAGGWELIHTGEFSLKIKPTRAAVRRLRKQLDLLEEQLAERT